MRISAAKRKACQINGRKSRGPKTTAGKQAVRFNAVQHGAAGKKLLPWEDQAAFAELVVGYKNAIQPVGEIENALAESLAFSCWQRARGVRAEVARATFNIHTARANEQREAEAAAASSGQQLFFEKHGPLALHPRPDSAAFGERTVWSNTPDDPDHPSRLVMKLEATFTGVRWLMARWRELRARLEAGECWHAPEKLKAVRLLSKLSYDAADDRNVAEIYLCCHVLDPQQQDDPFFEISYDMEAADYKRLRDRLVRRNVESMRPSDPVTARLNLLALVDRRIDRLSALSEQRLAFDDAMNALKTDINGFDGSVEGERLRRHIDASDRAFHRAIATIIKMRKNLETPEFDPTESTTDERATASAESGIENAESKGEALHDELLDTPEPTTAQTNEDDPTLQNGRDEIVRVSDLQNKPTDAGDEPQVHISANVQKPQNAPDNNEDFGPEDQPTAAIREQDLLGAGLLTPPRVDLSGAGLLTPPRVRPEVSSFPTPQSKADGRLEDEPTAVICQQDAPTENPLEAVGPHDHDGPSEGDGHLARQQPFLDTSPAESSIPDDETDDQKLQTRCVCDVPIGDLQNKPTEAGDEPQVQSPANVQEPENAPGNNGDLAPQGKPMAAIREQECDDLASSSGQFLSGGLHGQLVRELRRRELEQNQKDGFLRPDRRARRTNGLRNAQAFRKPERTFELPGDFPILASLPPQDFSRVLAEVQSELEQEIE